MVDDFWPPEVGSRVGVGSCCSEVGAGVVGKKVGGSVGTFVGMTVGAIYRVR